MSSVTFATSVGGDGSTVTDDADPTTGLDEGGHVTRFVPALSQTVAVAAYTVGQAQAAAASATAADASADQAAGYAATVGSYSAGAAPAQNPLNRMLGTMAYVDQTWLHASATWDPASIANAASATTTVTVPGAELGDYVLASRSLDSALILSGRVSAADTVTLTYANLSGGAIDPASHTVYVAVLKRIAK